VDENKDVVQSCGECRFSNQLVSGELVCRRLPPVNLTFPVKHPMTGEVGVSVRAMFPLIEVTFVCGEFGPVDLLVN